MADGITQIDATALGALAYVVLGASMLGYGIWTWLLSRYPASTVSPFALLVPVVGIAAAWVALGEEPGVVELLGAAVVLLGLGLLTGVVRPARRRLAVGLAEGGGP
jgi:O-acetylserine/cysteine efflux transporter